MTSYYSLWESSGHDRARTSILTEDVDLAHYPESYLAIKVCALGRDGHRGPALAARGESPASRRPGLSPGGDAQPLPR